MPTVALDIGHGRDTWENGGGKGVKVNGKVYEEHDFNSKVVLEIEKHLKRNDIQVKMIQKPFTNDVPLTTRTNYYNRENVDLVWSIHANAGASSGICSFYWHDHVKSERAAKLFIDEVNKAGYKTHGTGLHASMTGSWTNLHIVRETKMTAVLTENGFMTHSGDFENIFGKNQGEYVQDLGEIHAKAICRYFGMSYKPEINKEEVKVAEVDVNKVSPWAESNWEEAVINGYFSNDRPRANITREETAIVVNRIRHNYNGLIADLREEIGELRKKVEELKK
jgi:N-acetylmuramoyl-L-alanine amidase